MQGGLFPVDVGDRKVNDFAAHGVRAEDVLLPVYTPVVGGHQGVAAALAVENTEIEVVVA